MAKIYVGEAIIAGVYIGSSALESVYCGTTKIWPPIGTYIYEDLYPADDTGSWTVSGAMTKTGVGTGIEFQLGSSAAGAANFNIAATIGEFYRVIYITKATDFNVLPFFLQIGYTGSEFAYAQATLADDTTYTNNFLATQNNINTKVTTTFSPDSGDYAIMGEFTIYKYVDSDIYNDPAPATDIGDWVVSGTGASKSTEVDGIRLTHTGLTTTNTITKTFTGLDIGQQYYIEISFGASTTGPFTLLIENSGGTDILLESNVTAGSTETVFFQPVNTSITVAVSDSMANGTYLTIGSLKLTSLI